MSDHIGILVDLQMEAVAENDPAAEAALIWARAEIARLTAALREIADDNKVNVWGRNMALAALEGK